MKTINHLSDNFYVSKFCILTGEEYKCIGRYFSNKSKEFGISISIQCSKIIEDEIEIKLSAISYKRGKPPKTIWEDIARKEFLFDLKNELFFKFEKVPDSISKLEWLDQFSLKVVIKNCTTGNLTESDVSYRINRPRNLKVSSDLVELLSTNKSFDEFSLKGYPGSATIDAYPDGGATSLEHKLFPYVPKHSSTRQAINNLLASNSSVVTISGHGDVGKLVTYGGPNSGYSNGLIMYNNRVFWEDIVKDLRGKALLYIYSCLTGAGRSGAYLLHKLAVLTNMNVTAPTGLLYVYGDGTFKVEDGARWQTATPTRMPSPITPPRYEFTRHSSNIRLLMSSDYESVDSSQIETIEIIEHFKDDASNYFLEQSSFQEILKLIDFDNPFTTEGIPLAEKTVTIVFKTKNGEERLFTVLANRIVRDEIDPNTYYRTNELLSSFLNNQNIS
jgi:hypothetical protein